MRVLVTGAAGFIGSALCKKLSILGYEVLAIDNFSDYYSKSLKYQRVNSLLDPINLKVLDIDISVQPSLSSYIKLAKPDMVINLAAQAGVRLKFSENYKYVDSNLVGFNNLMTACIENNVRYFLYASSSSVYGNSSTPPFSEREEKLRPNSFYGVTKLANELLIKSTVEKTGMSARGLRFFTVYGPWGRPDMAYFRMLANVISGSDFKFFGDGSVERDFTYIEDVIDLVASLVVEIQSKGGGFTDVVNLGGGRPLSMNFLLQEIQKIANQQINFERFDSNSNDVIKTVADSSYLESLIGLVPKVRLEDGIMTTYKWAKQTEVARNLDAWVNSVI